MFQHSVHVPLFDDPNHRRTIRILLEASPDLARKHLWHWASILLPTDQIDQRTLTEQQRAEGYNAGLLYWCLIQEAELYATLCAAAHLRDLIQIDEQSTETLLSLTNDFHCLDGVLFMETEAGPDRSATFPDIEECAASAIASLLAIGFTIERRQGPVLPPKSGRPGFIYLLRSVSGYWKIGRTVSPQNRLKTFGIQLPFEVEFEHVIPTDNMVDSEMSLHARFAAKRVRGEWFALTDEDVTWIKALKRI